VSKGPKAGAGAAAESSASPDEYEAPATAGEAEERVERSRFLALARPIHSEADAAAFLKGLRDLHHKATHHCSAWRLGHPALTRHFGASDDGEPSGSAGLPILRAIESSGLSDVAVVVVRWYGGVKLGTGGLARAYGSTARLALEACPRQTVVERLPLFLRFSPSLMTQVRRLASQAEARECRLERGEDLLLELAVPRSRRAALELGLRELFQGKGELWT